MEKANTLLADRFERFTDRHGHPEASRDLREIVDKGVSIVAARKASPQSEGVRHVMTFVTSGRRAQLVEEIAADVQDLVKVRRGEHLAGIATAHGGLLFLPDVLIPNTQETIDRWRAFLDSLDHSCIATSDPRTGLHGRIPFRDGTWLSDIRFRPDAPAAIIADIETVEGSLFLRGHSGTSGAVTVRGTLYADVDQLAKQPSPVREAIGPVRLLAEKAHSAQDIALAPERFAAWGIGHGASLFFNDKIEYVMHAEQLSGHTVHALIECPGGKRIDAKSLRFVWNGERWTRFNRELPPELAYALGKKLERACATLGIGQTCLVEGRDASETLSENISRIATLLAMGRGEHSAALARTIPGEAREAVQEVENLLVHIRALAIGEGAYFYMGPEELTQTLTVEMDRLSDIKLTHAREAFDAHCSPVPLSALKADRTYLEGLRSAQLTLDEVLGTAGRTLVFLNNMFTSRQARARAAESIAPIRANLRGLLGTKPRDDMLLTLLKTAGANTMDNLKRRYGDHPGAVQALGKDLEALAADRPLRLIREFLNAPYRDVDEALEEDRALLSRLLEYGRGPLRDVLRPTRSRPDGELDGTIFRNCLLVNLQSFLAEDARTATINLDTREADDIVTELLDRLTRFAPIVPEYNRRCGAKS